jgi:integrase
MPPDGAWADLRGYLDWLAARFSPLTVRQRTWQLNRFAAAHPAGPWSVDLDQVEKWLAAQHAEASRLSELSALKRFYDWARRHGRCPASWTDPTADVLPIRVPDPGVLPCPQDAFWAAEDAADEDSELMLLLAAHCGLRCAEIAAVSTRDVVGDMLRIRGKFGKVRLVPLPKQIAQLMGERPAGQLFPGRLPGTCIKPGTVSGRLSRLLPAGWTAHTLRHAYATNAYLELRDIVAVQQLLGHASPATTRRYIAAANAAVLQSAAGAATRMPSRRRLRIVPPPPDSAA